MSRTRGFDTLHRQHKAYSSNSLREMYSDRIASSGTGNNRKRSVKDRLGVIQNKDEFSQQDQNKRFQGYDGKWQHDMYDEADDADNCFITKSEQTSNVDLRTKLKKNVPRGIQGGSGTMEGVRDLREKLSGPTLPPQPSTLTVSKPQQRSSSVTKNATPVVTTVSGSKPPTATPNVKPSGTQKPQKTAAGVETMTISSFLESLGLSKYAITFQAEEIDMPILRVMKDDELKELGIPMGPRKKIKLALDSLKR